MLHEAFEDLFGEVPATLSLGNTCNNATPAQLSANLRIGSPVADQQCLSTPCVDIATAMPTSSSTPRTVVRHCGSVASADIAMPCEKAVCATSDALIKPGRGPKLRWPQTLGTVGVLLIAGPSQHKLTVMAPILAAIARFNQTTLPAETCRESAQITIPQESAIRSSDREGAFLMYDPGGPWMRQSFLPSAYCF